MKSRVETNLNLLDAFNGNKPFDFFKKYFEIGSNTPIFPKNTQLLLVTIENNFSNNELVEIGGNGSVMVNIQTDLRMIFAVNYYKLFYIKQQIMSLQNAIFSILFHISNILPKKMKI